jgi:hypothetical protein
MWELAFTIVLASLR